MRFFPRFSFRGYDWTLFLIVVVLSSIGLAAMYSIDLSRPEELRSFPTQALAFGIGLFVMAGISVFRVSWFERMARLWYIAALLLLIFVLFFGVTVRGTTGWFRLFGFSFQPAEFAKVALVVFLGWWIERFGRRFDRWQFVVSTGLVAGLLALPIAFQPDIGSMLMLVGVWFGLLFFSRTKKRYLFFLAMFFLLTSVIGWKFFLEDYQKERFLTFLNVNRDPLGSGYNVRQSIIAVGAGGLKGRGLGFGSQSQLRFLPEAHTDFIFSVIAEELGFLGVSVLFLLYGALFYRLFRIALRSGSDFAAYTVLGILFLFVLHGVVNIGGAVGVLPLTGVTLPFVSYGGTSLIMNCLLIGIAQSIGREGHTAGG
ncbi:MAG: FtsW/RodA/SpoVE family cell cycle protein [Patescibacteria group bacterium]